ncbi:MAG: N-formylglutamate deformylase [Thermoleophilia bacterium]|nr:N-formylglutamate deformylase [Thermoleophilia bacterium]
MSASWLDVVQGAEPLVVSIPHAGTDLPPALLPRFVSPWLARKDTDWHVEKLYAFAAGLGATVVRTTVSRTVIDANRDPSGASLYPGQATTGLCPATTFDGEPLYLPGQEPAAEEVAARRAAWFDPYQAALTSELARLRSRHGRVVLYDCHSIRSVVPRLFDGVLPHLSIGTNGGRSCDPSLTAAIEEAIGPAPFSRVTDGRFRGGWITRHHGRPAEGVHAVQMELAMRGYLATESGHPPEYDEGIAAPMRAVLSRVLEACLAFARRGARQ